MSEAKRKSVIAKKNFLLIISLTLLAIGPVAALFVSQQRTELASRASSATITIPVMEDATVGKSKPTKNEGTDKQLKIDDDKISFLKFNFDSLAGQPITKATLRVYVLNDSKSTQQIKGLGDNNWSETGITFDTQPEPGEAVTQITDTKNNEWKEIDITEFVKLHAGKAGSFLIDANADNKNNLYLSSREGTNPPVVVVETANTSVTTAVIPTNTTAPTSIIVQQPSATPTTASGPTTRPATPTPTRVATPTPTRVMPTPTTIVVPQNPSTPGKYFV